MADRLALYRAVMGEVWDDELPRVRARVEDAARRQGRWRVGAAKVGAGGRGAGHATGRPSPSHQMRAALGGPSAVFKRIRAGGTKTPRALRDQLSYVNDKAAFVTSTLIPEPEDGAALSPAEKMEVVDAFTGRWRGDTKLGHTSHMLLSFPEGVPVETVRDVAVEWAERLFESGHYGDTWDYVLAVHDDRDHKHAHVILNNRGRDHGTWFSCWREGVMSPQHMRELQAEIAAEHGVTLHATSRLERGIVTEPAPMPEVYAAREQGRRRREVEPGPMREAEGRDAGAQAAVEHADLADLLDDHDHGPLATAVRALSVSVGRAAAARSDLSEFLGEADHEPLAWPARAMRESLASRQPWEAEMAARDAGVIEADEVRTVGDAIDWAEDRWSGLDAQVAGLGSEDRARMEVEAAPVKAELAEMLPDAERREMWTSEMEAAYPPGAGLAGHDRALAREGLDQGRHEAVEAVAREGQALGLDVDEMAARLEAGGTRNLGLAREWAERDTDRILSASGIEPEQATPEEREAAVARLDAFQDRMHGALLEAGAEERQVVDLAEARAAREATPQAAAEPTLEVRDETPEAGPTAPTPEGAPAAPSPEDREPEQAEQAAYLEAHPEVLRSPAEVYTVAPDGTAELRQDGAAPRVMRDLSEMGLTGREEDAEARIAAALSERHPDMPDHVARDVAITYASTAELVDQQGGLERERSRGALGRDGGADAELDGGTDPALQALAGRMRAEDIPDEEKAQVAAELEESLRRRLTPEQMARLDRGDETALEDVLPSQADRMVVVHEREEMKRDLSRERGLENDMDDDMGM